MYREPSVDERRDRQEQQQRSPLRTERGITRIEDNIVAKVARIAAQEVKGIQMGGATARIVGGFRVSVTGSGGQAGVLRWK